MEPSNTPALKQFSLSLPTRETVEVVVFRRADGKLIARAAHELTPAPLATPGGPNAIK
jgi:hypothetical protein